MASPLPGAPAAATGPWDGAAPWFAVITALVLLGGLLGYAGCLLLGVAPPAPAALAVFLAIALGAGGAGAALLDRVLLSRLRHTAGTIADLQRRTAPNVGMQAMLTTRSEQVRRMRHDIRGALSPALLVADRLVNHSDPAVQRAGEIMVRTVDRAIGLLAESDGKPKE